MQGAGQDLHDSIRSRILVLGSGKSGTTGLYSAIFSGVERIHGERVKSIFEPKTIEDISSKLSEVMVVKMLLERFTKTDQSLLGLFDKIVFVYRDPRDNIVSRLLWQTASLKGIDSVEKVEKAISLLKKKENDRHCLSVIDLYRQIGGLAGVPNWFEGAIRYAFLPLKFISIAEENCFILKYEDYIDGHVDDLNMYLGFDVVHGAPPPAEFAMTMRTASHGSWRLWFNEEDVEYFLTHHRSEMIRMGYSNLDGLSEEKRISSRESSDYLLDNLRIKRADLF